MENAPPSDAAPPADDLSLLAALASDRAHGSEAGASRPTPFGKYTLHRSLGRGGFGEVFLATEDATWKKVAIKILSNRRRADADARKRFELEIKIGRVLKHANILPVIDDGEVSGLRYFAAPFIEGEDLLHRIAKKPLAVQVAVETIQRVTDAVAEAHRQGVLHRDLKPANILIEAKTGKPYVADFGLAKQIHAASPQTETLAVLGTQPYMPPEQADPNLGDFSPATDVYALGASLYHALTGRTPFPRPDRPNRDILSQIAWDRPIPPSAINAQVPRELDRLCLICLEKHPFDRYETAHEMAADLVRFIEGRPILARSPSGAKRLVRRCARQPILTASVLGLFVVSMLGGTLAWYFAQEASRSSTELSTVAPRLQEAETKTASAVSERIAAESDRDAAQVAAAEAARRKALQSYASDMREIASAWQKGDMVRVSDLLDRTKPSNGQTDYRGIEWYSWERQLRAICRRFNGKGPFRGVALSERGNILAAVNDESVSVWDVETRRLLLQRTSGPDRARAFGFETVGYRDQGVAVSTDGTLIAVTYPGKNGGSVRVWDAQGKERMAVTNDPALSGIAVAFSPDGKFLLAGGYGGTWTSWDTSSMALGKPEIETRFGRTYPDAIDDPTVALWFAGPHELHAFGYDAGFNACAWAWVDLDSSLQRLSSSGGANPILAITPSLDLLTPPKEVFGVITNFQPITRPLDRQHQIWCSIRSDNRVVAGCRDNIVRIWSVPRDERDSIREPESLKGAPASIQAVAHAAYRTAAACSDGTVCVWPGESLAAESWTQPTLPPSGTYPSPSGRWSIVHDGAMAILKDANGDEVLSLAVREFPLNRVVWSVDEAFVAVYCSNQGQGLNIAQIDRSQQSRIMLVSTADRRQVATLPSADGLDVMALVFSPDSRWLCVGTQNHGSSLYRTSDGSNAAQLDIGGWVARFSARGGLLAVADDKNTGVWNIDRGDWARRTDGGAADVGFDLDERSLLLAALGDARHLRRIDLASGEVSEIPMSSALLRNSAMSGDGSRIYASDGASLQVFLSNATDGEPIYSVGWVGLPADAASMAKSLDERLKVWSREWRESLAK